MITLAPPAASDGPHIRSSIDRRMSSSLAPAMAVIVVDGERPAPPRGCQDTAMALDPLLDFTDQVVLVTGGSRGLGYQMVRAFAERGADVVVASRKLDNCEKVADEVRALGRRALPHSVHAAHWDSIDQLIEDVYAELGRVDILVNNAGMSPAMRSHE